jgi:hypothetical protein
MAQVSGSISLEMSKVVRETTRAILDALLTRQAPDKEVTLLEEITVAVSGRLERELGGMLAEVRTALARLEELISAESQRRGRPSGPRPLDWDSLVATLSHHLPTGVTHPKVGDGFKVAAFQAAHLTEAGYAIVPVSGEALAAQETESA